MLLEEIAGENRLKQMYVIIFIGKVFLSKTLLDAFRHPHDEFITPAKYIICAFYIVKSLSNANLCVTVAGILVYKIFSWEIY